MVLISIDGAHAAVRKQDILTVGMVGAEAEFLFFGEEWDSLGKTAVFRQGDVTKDAPIYGSVVTIPWEVLQMSGVPVSIGVYGASEDGTVVIPTVWVKTNPVQPGADPSDDESADPALPVWAQMQAKLDEMYGSTEEIDAAKAEMLQAIEAGKEDIRNTVAEGNFYTKAESGEKFASAITGRLVGEAVNLRDASPVEHRVKVTVIGDEAVDLTTVPVTRIGKNLFDPSAVVRMAIGADNQTSSVYITVKSTYRGFYCPCKAGDVFSLSRSSKSNNRFRCTFSEVEPADRVSCIGNATSVMAYDEELKIENIVAPENAKYIFVYLSNQADPLPDIQLEYGKTATDYEAYIAPETYTPNADGTVGGVVSMPGMTLLTDAEGVTLDVEYNRDTNAVIAELLDRVFPAARIANVSLVASKWTGSGSLYSQVVAVPGVTENSQVDLTPSAEQLSIFYDKDLAFVTENEGGVVTVYAIGQKPQNDYTIQATITEVNV